MKSFKSEIIILGLTPAGLFLLREFSRNGKKVLAVGLGENIGLYSKYGKKILLNRIEEVENVFKKYLYPDTVIYISSDPFINYLLDKQHVVFKRNKCFPDFKSAKIFSDKLLTGKLAEKLKIDLPMMHRFADIEIDQMIEYPIILKWNKRKTFNEPFKTILINSEIDLKRAKKEYRRYLSEIILQKYIPEENTINISYGGYFLNGKEIIEIIVQQKRQYPKGLTSFVEEYKGKYFKKIQEISRKIITNANFNGFAEVEFIVDVKNNHIYFIEVNPRTWGWIKVLKRKYKKLNLDLPGNEHISNGHAVCSTNIVRDARAILNILIKNPDKRKIKSIIEDYRKKPITDIFEIDDLKPFLYQFKKIIR